MTSLKQEGCNNVHQRLVVSRRACKPCDNETLSLDESIRGTMILAEVRWSRVRRLLRVIPTCRVGVSGGGSAPANGETVEVVETGAGRALGGSCLTSRWDARVGGAVRSDA